MKKEAKPRNKFSSELLKRTLKISQPEACVSGIDLASLKKKKWMCVLLKRNLF